MQGKRRGIFFPLYFYVVRFIVCYLISIDNYMLAGWNVVCFVYVRDDLIIIKTLTQHCSQLNCNNIITSKPRSESYLHHRTYRILATRHLRRCVSQKAAIHPFAASNGFLAGPRILNAIFIHIYIYIYIAQ